MWPPSMRRNALGSGAAAWMRAAWAKGTISSSALCAMSLGAAIRGAWGGDDWTDVQAVIGFMKEQPWVDTKRMGVMGGSYGGYMTIRVLADDDRFPQQHPTIKTTHSLKFQPAIFLDLGDHKADFVHVGSDHHP